MRFLHTADLQIGKPYQSIEDTSKRESLRRQRLDTLKELREHIEKDSIKFAVICGDLFDSATPEKATVSALCSAIGSLQIPVYAIPGNHDHGGPGCIWQQPFFTREKEQLAPNLHILLEAKPLVLDSAVLLPCPLLRRHESGDPLAWLQTPLADIPTDLPRIVLAHGSTQGFSSRNDEDDAAVINRLNLERLPQEEYDYIALGDWHGCKQVSANAWYSGTPEQDRFGKGENNRPGHVLSVSIEGRGGAVQVNEIASGKINWYSIEPVSLNGDNDLGGLKERIDGILGQRTGQDLLQLEINGALSFSGRKQLDEWIESLQARLLRLNLNTDIQLEPSDEELDALSERQDPLIADVARGLREEMDSNPLAREALRELHLLTERTEA